MMQALLFVSLIVYVYSAPMTKDEAMSYLEKYGYMTGHSEENMEPAIMAFQKFMGLPLTGSMNSDTDKMMNMPRCGMKDMKPTVNLKRKRRYAVQGSRWRNKVRTYKIGKYSDQLPTATIDRELKEAFDVWSPYLNITFMPKKDGIVDIDVGFYKHDHGDGASFDGRGRVLAHAFYPIFGGDIHFDESEPWTSEEDKGINFKVVAVHEIGHTLGLDHSMDKRAIMFPTYNGYDANIRLGKDDVQGIQWLYTKQYK